jgi:2-polyprenyl-3-methyl-5-hydroxy-6-metoxy-1,4-benzoquinol methylase
MNGLSCRFCQSPLVHTFVDLGMSPLANSYLDQSRLNQSEVFYPLHALVCEQCFLVQLQQFEPPENIFSNYVYFSSYSRSWLEHSQEYANRMIERFDLSTHSTVVEIASNDGYLLQYFKASGIPVLGIEPAANVSVVAREKGIPTLTAFFGRGTALSMKAAGQQADLIVANNVLAHVPDLHDFVDGFKLLLKPGGIVSFEFPHLLRLINGRQFDTIYHEHLSYFSFLTAGKIFKAHGLAVFDVEELQTHGGSLRVYLCHAENREKSVHDRVEELRKKEIAAGLCELETYLEFGKRVREAKHGLLERLIEIKRSGASIAAYGAPAKGNTLLNYCGIGKDFIEYAVDQNPHKQGLFLPGSHIPIVAPSRLSETRPNYILILPWNLRDEILAQIGYARAWACRFVIPVPTAEILA